MRSIRKTVSVITALLILAVILSIPVNAGTVTTTQVPYESYTYWEGVTGATKKAVYSKPMYEPKRHISASDLALKRFYELTDVFSDDENVYMLDSRAPSIIILDNKYNYVYEIKEIENSEGDIFDYSGALGIFVSKNKNIYIADTENARVLVSDKNGKLIKELDTPKSSLIPKNFQFRPTAVAVSKENDIYVLSDGSFYGAIVFNNHYDFQGFYGSNTVKSSVAEGISKIFTDAFMTDAKKENSEKSLPFQFTDLCIDDKGFIYTTTGKTETDKNGVGQIKKLSPSGSSILGGDSYNYVDEGYADIKGNSVTTRVQDLLSLDVDNDGYIFALDSTYGRVFVYNSENRLMSAFGGGIGKGTHLGTFSSACAIAEHRGDLLVCDSTNNNITVFSPTEYGLMYMKANLMTKNGEYAESKDLWRNILNLDSNNQLAYIGLAKAYIAEGDYSTALRYAKEGYDRELYDQAFEKVRKQYIGDNFTLLFVGTFIVIAGIISIVLIIKKKKIKVIRNKQLSLMCSTITHPFNTFDLVAEKNEGSVLIASILIVLYYVSTVVKAVYSGFSFNMFDSSSFNSIFILVRSIGLVLLWTVCNWAVSTLFNGKGSIRKIYISSSYCLLPLIFGDFVYFVASNVLTSKEGAFLNIFSTIMIMAASFYLIVAMIRIHDYTFGQFVYTSLMTVFGIVLIIFFLFLVGVLVQQLFGFSVTFIDEFATGIGGLL